MNINRRSKRERDPSESRTRKRLVTHINHDLNEKENKPNEKQIGDIKIDSNIDMNNVHQTHQINQQNNNLINKLDLPDESIDSLSSFFNDQQNENELMELTLQSNQTLKQKLVSLNNSKFVIEEGEENEEFVESDDLDGSEYDGEDLSENDENYIANDYPEEPSEDELDYYRPYEDDYEREMLEKFEKINWNDDQSDYSD